MNQRFRQRGIGLVTAIFLVVVIAGLAAALVTVFTSQQTGNQLDQQGARAYQAARAGIEWGLFRARMTPSNCAASTSFALPGGSMLGAFTVTVTCETIPGPGNDAATAVISLRAIACNQPSAGVCSASPGATNNVNLDYVQRVVEVQVGAQP
jgi:MSHA biogenesis protein MshP